MENLEKSSPPPLVKNRSPKKAKFRMHGEDEDNPNPLSFKDMLMEDRKELEEELTRREEDLEFEQEDVVIENRGLLPSISFSQQLAKPWMNAVVVKLLGRSIGYEALCNRLEALWGGSQGFSVIDLGNNFYLVWFRNESDAHHALTQGPWTILGHYLTVQQWNPQFDSTNDKIDSIVAWIRLPGMPLHYYHKRVIRMLGQIIGKVIKIDYNTESATRGKFARIAVQVSLDKPLCSQFLLDGKLQKIEYENLSTICFQCGRYGHKSDVCPEQSVNNSQGGTIVDWVNSNLPGDSSDKPLPAMNPASQNFGPWMVVSRKGKGRIQKETEIVRRLNHASSNHSKRGSRFDALNNEDLEGEDIIISEDSHNLSDQIDQPQIAFL